MRRVFCLLVVTRARANVDVPCDVEGPVAATLVPRPGPVQTRRHKGRGAQLADLAIQCVPPSNIPNGRIALLEARAAEEGGGQKREGDDAEVRVSGRELLGCLHTCVHPNAFVLRVGNGREARL